jgi:hypothetical protein
MAKFWNITLLTDDTGAGGEANTASNVGTGIGVFDTKNGVDLEFNSLIGGTGITVADTTQDLTISVDGTEFATTDLSDTANIAYLNTANTFINGNLQTFGDDDIRIADLSNNNYATFSVNELTLDRTVSIPALGGNEVFVFQGVSQTLTNKGIALGSNTITGTGAQFDTAVTDENFVFESDNLSALSTSTLAQLNTHISDATIVDLDDIQTLTNKDLSSSTNTFPNLEQLANVTSTGCAVGEILKVSGTTWQCATDDTGAGGEANTASNVGTGIGVFDTKNGVDLEFNSLIGGTGITVADTTQDLTISAELREVFNCSDGMSQVSNTPNKRTEDASNMDYVVCEFDTTTAETIIWSTVMPDSYVAGTIDVTVNAVVDTGGNTASACFDVSFLGLAQDEVVNSAFSAVSGACTGTIVIGDFEEATMSGIASGTHNLAAGDLVYIKLARDVAADSNTGDVGVISIEVEWN